MPKFNVTVGWSGFSAGFSTYEVNAENEQQAKEIYSLGKKVDHSTTQDEIDNQISSVTEVEDLQEKLPF